MLPYVWLLGGWVLFGALHSAFAAVPVKRWVSAHVGRAFRYYRIVYNVLAVVLLLGLIVFQFGYAPVAYLVTPSVPLKALGALAVVMGLWVMCVAIGGYNRREFAGLDTLETGVSHLAPSELKLDGLARYVRHPLYFGTLLFTWGIFLCQPTAANLLSDAFLTAYVWVGSRFEERKLLREFGEAYRQYRRRVPALLPRLRSTPTP